MVEETEYRVHSIVNYIQYKIYEDNIVKYK